MPYLDYIISVHICIVSTITKLIKSLNSFSTLTWYQSTRLAILPPMAAQPTLDITKAITDASSPYFLHSSDQPSNVLVDTPLNGDNYSAWCRAVTRAHNAKNKLGFVNGTLSKPTDRTASALWDRCCNMIMSWLLHSIEKTLASSLVYCATPFDLWAEGAARCTERFFTESTQNDVAVEDY
ncbi:uncharacterized protein LOC111384475 [Olea europaea var. sylvestris]|uniref:uncharacterized protein LOC111384475 n=1 Tax=Olea europaea var. sylvestris TaxID=158386 RepID=UPI000C1D84DD|nr:uncharacterized protein LOC111384475 [Olea europaea var. sylvestris]